MVVSSSREEEDVKAVVEDRVASVRRRLTWRNIIVMVVVVMSLVLGSLFRSVICYARELRGI